MRVCKIVEAENGYRFISTSDDYDVIAGQEKTLKQVSFVCKKIIIEFKLSSAKYRFGGNMK